MKNDNTILKKQFWGYVYVYAFTYLSGTISGIVDGWFASNYLGFQEIAAFGLCAPYFKVLTMIGVLLSFGMQVECTRKLSNGDLEGSNRIFSSVIQVSLLISLGIMLLGFYALSPICYILGANGENAALSAGIRAYSIGFFPGIPALLICTIFPVAINICGDKKIVVAATFTQTTVNIALDFAALHIFHLGLTGLALATSGAAVCSVIVMLYYMLFKQKMFKFRFELFTISGIKDITKGGLPNFIRKISALFSDILMNNIILLCGSQVMASRSIVNTLSLFFLTVMVGITGALHLMVQFFFQEKNVGRIRWLVGYSLRIICICGIALSVIINIFSPVIVKLFNVTPEIYSYLVPGLCLYSFTYVFSAITEALFRYIQASGNFIESGIYAAIGKIVLVIIALPMTKIFGSTGMWLSFTIAEILTALIYLLHRLIYSLCKKISYNRSVLLISDELEQTRQRSVEWTITTMEDAIGISQQVWDYLESQNVDKRKNYFASLGIEEMAIIFAEKAAKDSKIHRCSIFMIYTPEEILIRFQDDCHVFNVCRQYEMMQEGDDRVSHVGIRLLFGIAKQLEYSSIMNLNTVVLKI